MKPEWHGGDHGWIVDESKIDKESIVFDVGVGLDLSWVESLHDKFGCKIYSFDPTPGSIKFVEDKALPWLKFFPVGIWVEDCTRPFHPHSCKGFITHSIRGTGPWSGEPDCEVSLCTITKLMEMAGVDHVDVLKVCLGNDDEYSVVSSLLLQKTFPAQVLLLTLHFSEQNRELIRYMLRSNGYTRMIMPGREPTRESYVR